MRGRKGRQHALAQGLRSTEARSAPIAILIPISRVAPTDGVGSKTYSPTSASVTPICSCADGFDDHVSVLSRASGRTLHGADLKKLVRVNARTTYRSGAARAPHRLKIRPRESCFGAELKLEGKEFRWSSAIHRICRSSRQTDLNSQFSSPSHGCACRSRPDGPIVESELLVYDRRRAGLASSVWRNSTARSCELPWCRN